MKIEWLGLQDYEFILNQQKASLKWPIYEEAVWGLEHTPIITLGRRANGLEEITPYEFSARLPVFQTDRGGLATIHSPGQLVIYPLLSLRRREMMPKQFVEWLLQITKKCLFDLGVETNLDQEKSGLFIDKKKIAFVGLRLSEGRSYHGISLNVNNDLSLFEQIRSCGLQRRPTTNLIEQGLKASTQDVFDCWIRAARHLNLEDFSHLGKNY